MYSAGRKLLLAVASGCLLLGLHGCLINRVVEVRDQFCDFEEHFEVRFADRPSVHMRQPVLLDSDVTWLVGTAPTQTASIPGGLIMTYEIEEAVPEPDPGRDISVEFRFDLLNGEFRLSEISMDPKLDAILNREFLDKETLLESAENICRTGWTFGSTSVELDITDQELELLPNRRELVELLGPPHALTDAGAGWVYEYRLKEIPDSDKIARFTVWFDDLGQKPVRMESSYARYRTSADFVAKKMSMNVEL